MTQINKNKNENYEFFPFVADFRTHMVAVMCHHLSDDNVLATACIWYLFSSNITYQHAN